MVHVPAGTFTMGSATGVGDDDERPAHRVTLGGYCLDTTEVTVAAYGKCVAAGTCSATTEPAKTGFDQLCNGTRSDRQSHPVNCVDWNQSKAYCTWANKRLPTEAEWEYAARGSDGRTYPWGNDAPSSRLLNACGSECVAMVKRILEKDRPPMYPADDGWEATAPAGSFPAGASPFGALDMAGNVWEWTADWHGAYAAGAAVNPTGPANGAARVNRGGGWNSYGAGYVRGAFRNGFDPSFRVTLVGFRCARGD